MSNSDNNMPMFENWTPPKAKSSKKGSANSLNKLLKNKSSGSIKSVNLFEEMMKGMTNEGKKNLMSSSSKRVSPPKNASPPKSVSKKWSFDAPNIPPISMENFQEMMRKGTIQPALSPNIAPKMTPHPALKKTTRKTKPTHLSSVANTKVSPSGREWLTFAKGSSSRTGYDTGRTNSAGRKIYQGKGGGEFVLSATGKPRPHHVHENNELQQKFTNTGKKDDKGRTIFKDKSEWEFVVLRGRKQNPYFKK